MKTRLLAIGCCAFVLTMFFGSVKAENVPIPVPAKGDTWTYRTTIEEGGKQVDSYVAIYKLGDSDQKSQFAVLVTDGTNSPKSDTVWDSLYSIDSGACMIDFFDRRSLAKERTCQTKLDEGSTWESERTSDGMHILEKFRTSAREHVQLASTTYEAVRIDGMYVASIGGKNTALPAVNDQTAFHTTYWYVPEIKALVKKVVESPPTWAFKKKITSELVAFLDGNSEDAKKLPPGSVNPVPPPKIMVVDNDAQLEQTCIPSYPDEAVRYNLQGTVLLEFLINTKGKVVDSKVLKSSGWKVLDDAAVKVFSNCRYKPATENGKPVEGKTKIRYIWNLMERDGTDVPPSLIKDSCSPSSQFTIAMSKVEQPTILLRFLVDEKGMPYGIKVEDGGKEENTNKAAIDLLQSCRFTPETLNGKPIQGASSIRLMVNGSNE